MNIKEWLKEFFRITKERILWFIIFAIVSIFIIFFKRSELYSNLLLAGAFGGLSFQTLLLLFFMVIITRALEILLIYPFLYFFRWSGDFIIVLFLEIIRVYILACLVAFIHKQIKEKGFKKFIKFAIIIIVVISLLIFALVTQIETSKEQSLQSAINKSTEEACAKLSSEYEAFCSRRLAEKTLNPNFCKKAGDDKDILGFKDMCYKDIAQKTVNATICNNIKNPFQKNDCLLSIARTTNNSELCKNLPNSILFESHTEESYYYFKDYCYDNIAINTNDPNLCELAGHLTDSCFEGIARQSKKIEYCYKITNNVSKRNCINYINSSIQ